MRLAVIPTAQDRAPKNGQDPVHVGSGGALSHDSATANATNTLPATETGGRMAHANQQVEEGMQPKQTKDQAPSSGVVGGGEGAGRTHQGK
ncbi:hypothetical protein Rt10032_c05g2390 [Rhodotorula toruloides]|uniref:Uncharacterized protein n=1 Tax=Rhodotorula toruloides TaxID=5286 RepID=A0A511KDD5_RHOTO|nr:hypothetical protein Rt10032_c05g2390 [Rhodotorula toruloides]